MAVRRALASLPLIAAALAAAPAIQSPAAQEPAFVAIGAAPPAVLRIEFAPDLRIEIEDGELFVVVTSGGGRSAVPRTAPTGRVHALTRDANGTVFAGTDAGLFVLDSQHIVLDPADVRDGVPEGAVRGLLADGEGRVWLCTDTAFGVMDARFAFGRTFTAADGLPAPPFAGVHDGGGGRVVLVTTTGAFAYTPDRGPPPRARDGFRRDAFAASPDGVAVVSLGAEGLGGATLRQRRRHHHLLEAMDGGNLRGLRSGRHVVDVYAVDRDLRRELVAEYTVTVPLPKALDPRVLPAAAVAFGLLLLVLAFRGADRGTSIGRRIVAAAGSTTLLLVVSVQLLAACLGYGRSWPFVGFSMYTETYGENAVLHRPRITALRADGTRCPLREHEAGVVQDGYWQMLAEVVHGGDDAARRFLAQLDAQLADGEPRYSGFVLGDGRIRLTADGPVDVAPTIFVRWPR